MEENRKKTTCNRIFGARKNTPSETGRSLVGRCNKGFTLVELIVVLIVLAIVAAIVVPALLGFNDKGKEATYKMEAQKALAATQAALSDIYNDAGNRFDHDKRDRVKELAGAGDKTAFTVWTEKTLMDGYTTAVAENIGSYTIKKAVYKANDGLYFYYDGKNWTSFDNENDATAGVTGNEKNNVIFVWPYDGKTDFALNDNGNQQGQQGGEPIQEGDNPIQQEGEPIQQGEGIGNGYYDENGQWVELNQQLDDPNQQVDNPNQQGHPYPLPNRIKQFQRFPSHLHRLKQALPKLKQAFHKCK